MANPILAVGNTPGQTGSIAGVANSATVLTLIGPVASSGSIDRLADVLVSYTGSNGALTPLATLTAAQPSVELIGAGTFVVTRNAGNVGVDAN